MTDCIAGQTVGIEIKGHYCLMYQSVKISVKTTFARDTTQVIHLHETKQQTTEV